MRGEAVFLVNLLQDVSILRPLVFIAARDLGLRTTILVSRRFVERDKFGLWQPELAEIASATAAPLLRFDSELQAVQLLQGRGGVLIAGSESDSPGHEITHRVFRAAPPSFLRITLQHGFECVGFLHNRAHDAAYGRNVTFAADVVCGWCEPSRLASLAPSQRAKLYVSGPPGVLQMQRGAGGGESIGLVCENLHSVRLNSGGDFKGTFMDLFGGFCRALEAEGRTVALRPHPGGQYSLRHDVPMRPNVVLDKNPIYKVPFGRYGFGISAPSSVLIDMVLAGIPAAAWRDAGGAIDAHNYDGLAEVRTLPDWLEFAREALAQPARFAERQRRFLERQAMPHDPPDVYQRFASLLRTATRRPFALARPGQARERVLLISNANGPTLQICLLKPLAALVERGEIAVDFLSEEEMRGEFGERMREPVALPWIERRFAAFAPTMVVFCRYSGPHADYMVEHARREGLPVLFHIDDDLLNVPATIGLEKQKSHGHPLRLAAVRHLLDHADLVYCSTAPLRERFAALGARAPLVNGPISCAGEVLAPARERPLRRLGYMGFDHDHDLQTVLPALVAFLRNHPEVELQLLGRFSRHPALEEFGERVVLLPPVREYEPFLRFLAELQWDIGICPLAPTSFNALKANNKWIEYTSVGAAVVASRGTVYDECCADGCGLLAFTTEEWLAALEKLAADPAERCAQVRRAQRKLETQYSLERLRSQVLAVFARAKERRTQADAQDLRV